MAFLLSSTNIEIKKREEKCVEPESCIYSCPQLKINELDFFLDIKNVARYRVSDGQKIEVFPYENADKESVCLFPEGSAMGAVLHQRGLLPFHGSSFVYKGKGIMICGHSGIGKSSVTAVFCREGSNFINDDITPVAVSDSTTTILPLKTRIKLWYDSLRKLEIDFNQLQRIRPDLDKFYLPMEKRAASEHKLDHIFILSSHQKDVFLAMELEGMRKYNALRQQIYRRIYLKGMPETEKKYFRQLFSVAANVRVTYIIRPQVCDIQETSHFIEKEIVP